MPRLAAGQDPVLAGSWLRQRQRRPGRRQPVLPIVASTTTPSRWRGPTGAPRVKGCKPFALWGSHEGLRELFGPW
jgi:hypothetical protein